MTRKNVSDDQQRVDRKGFNEFSLEQGECAEQQADNDEDHQQNQMRTKRVRLDKWGIHCALIYPSPALTFIALKLQT